MKVLHDNILVEPATIDSKTVSGLLIPDSVREKPIRGTVVAIGPGKKGIPMGLEVGSEILYGEFAGNRVLWNGKMHVMLKEKDIFMVL